MEQNRPQLVLAVTWSNNCHLVSEWVLLNYITKLTWVVLSCLSTSVFYVGHVNSQKAICMLGQQLMSMDQYFQNPGKFDLSSLLNSIENKLNPIIAFQATWKRHRDTPGEWMLTTLQVKGNSPFSMRAFSLDVRYFIEPCLSTGVVYIMGTPFPHPPLPPLHYTLTWSC